MPGLFAARLETGCLKMAPSFMGKKKTENVKVIFLKVIEIAKFFIVLQSAKVD